MKVLSVLVLTFGFLGLSHAHDYADGAVITTTIVKDISISKKDVAGIKLSFEGIESGCGKPSIAYYPEPRVEGNIKKLEYSSVVSPCINGGIPTRQVVSLTHEVPAEFMDNIQVTYSANLKVKISTIKK